MHNLWTEKRGKFPWDLHTSKRGLSIESFHMTSRQPYLCSKNSQTAAKPILWELNSFLMWTLSFVPMNLHRCWPSERKRSIPVFPVKICILQILYYMWIVSLLCIITFHILTSIYIKDDWPTKISSSYPWARVTLWNLNYKGKIKIIAVVISNDLIRR